MLPNVSGVSKIALEKEFRKPRIFLKLAHKLNTVANKIKFGNLRASQVKNDLNDCTSTLLQ